MADALDQGEDGGVMSLTQAIGLTPEARVIISAKPPHAILHTSPAFFMISGQPFHTIQSCPLSSVLHLNDDMKECIERGRPCSTSRALIVLLSHILLVNDSLNLEDACADGSARRAR